MTETIYNIEINPNFVVFSSFVEDMIAFFVISDANGWQ